MKLRVLLVCSHGGHLTEIEQIMEAFAEHTVTWVTYKSPTTSHLRSAFLVPHFGDSFLRILLTVAFTTLVAFKIIAKCRPNVIVSTGSEIAIPFFYLGKFSGCYTIFLESLTRATRGSATGRLVRYFSDKFLVQWPTLIEFYHNDHVEYWGSVL